MATPGATKRLTREYKILSESSPEYITAHPSESNILEWHYILNGPPKTPYEGGQFWGSLTFPPDYPFKPPAIRMHTPSGRFQPSTRLCLSISDFHPKSFNPAWEVRTILLGILSFMTSEEMTTGSIRASDNDRKIFAARTRWWNTTGGGSRTTSPGATVVPTKNSGQTGAGAVKAGDGGAKFRKEWPELDEENWKWIKEKNIDPATGAMRAAQGSTSCSPEAAALRRRPVGSGNGIGAVMEGGQNARQAGRGWFRHHRFHILAAVIVGYVVLARLLGEGVTTPSVT